MLKIKNNVDLQRLVDEFGFKYVEGTYIIIGMCGCNPTYSISINENRVITIEPQNSNEVYDAEKDEVIYIGWQNNEIYDLIYDLIKADLVEKVGE